MTWRGREVNGDIKCGAWTLALALLAGAALFGPSSALASSGDLDRSFSGDGLASSYFGASGSTVNDVAIDPQGRVVAAGVSYKRTTHDDIALARYLPDGSPDPSFSGDGRMRTNWPIHDRATAVAIDSKGRIVVAGEALIARFLPGGKPDPAFSGDGRVKLPLEASDTDLAIDAHGRIVAAGSAWTSDGMDFGVVRLHPNGTLDRSFGTDGTVTINFGGFDIARSVSIDSLGRIVVGGYSDPDNRPNSFALARLRPNGSLDPAFSDDGRQTTVIGNDSDATSVAIDDRNRVVAGGEAYSNDAEHFAIARYRNDGSLDPSFSHDGTALNTSFEYADARAVTIDPEGRIVLAGRTFVDPDTGDDIGLALARYTPSGSLDTSFGNGGTVLSFAGYATLNAVATDAQGRIVGGGAVGSAPNHADFSVVRYVGGP